jgi:hypothetical protein
MNKITKWIIVIFSLLVIQTLTYLTLGPILLKNNLLPEYFPSANNNSESLLVVNPPASECNVGNKRVNLSQNIRQIEQQLKKKFNVRYVVFNTDNPTAIIDTTGNINLVYSNWTTRWNWTHLFGLYGATQTETLRLPKNVEYKREGTYHWILFFWVHTFEWFHSADLK